VTAVLKLKKLASYETCCCRKFCCCKDEALLSPCTTQTSVVKKDVFSIFGKKDTFSVSQRRSFLGLAAKLTIKSPRVNSQGNGKGRGGCKDIETTTSHCDPCVLKKWFLFFLFLSTCVFFLLLCAFQQLVLNAGLFTPCLQDIRGRTVL
jgi:hypothetical protein